MADWSIIATVKAPLDQVLAFLAHHLPLGPARIRLCFDDPEDPALPALSGLDPRVEALRCGPRYWARLRVPRPDKHQARQAFNAQFMYRSAAEAWLLHLDVDEFLLPSSSVPVADLLDAVPKARPLLRISPWEALHSPGLPDDIFTARHFRAELSGPHNALHRAQVFGPYAPLLPAGVLSHAIGKCFFRTGIADLKPWIHGAKIKGQRVPPGPPAPDLALLHFHAHDPAPWRRQLPFRLARGAYVLKPELQAFLQGATPTEIDAFYTQVQTATPQALTYLHSQGLLCEADLTLRQKILHLTGPHLKGPT